MTALLDPESDVSPSPGLDDDWPRSIDPALPRVDKVFHASALGIGITVLVIMGAIGVFLGWQSIPT